MTVVVITIIIIKDSRAYLPLSELSMSPSLFTICTPVSLISIVICVSCVCTCQVFLIACFVAFCSFGVYTYDSKFIAGVPSSRLQATPLLYTTRMRSIHSGRVSGVVA